jgi:hypothetical protein
VGARHPSRSRVDPVDHRDCNTVAVSLAGSLLVGPTMAKLNPARFFLAHSRPTRAAYCWPSPCLKGRWRPCDPRYCSGTFGVYPDPIAAGNGRKRNQLNGKRVSF